MQSNEASPKTYLSLEMKLALLFLFVVVPLTLIIYFVNDYAIRLLKSQATAANQDMLQISLDQIEDTLDEKSKYLFNLAFVNSSVSTLGALGEESPAYHYAKSDLRNYMLQEGIASDSWVDGYFVFIAKTQEFVTSSLRMGNYDEKQQGLQDLELLLKRMPENTADSGWFSKSIAGKQRLVRFIRNADNVYVAVMINIDGMQEVNRLRQLDSSGEIIALSNTGDILTSQELSMEWTNELRTMTGNRYDYMETRIEAQKYLLFAERSEQAGITIVKRLPEQQLLRQMSYSYRIIQIIPVGLFIALVMLLIIIRQVVLKPIHVLMNGMKKIKEGNWSYRLKAGTNHEFRLINATFNEMVEQINNLKINIYEEKLKGQHTEIQRLQLQIHPHFLLNSLNMVYNLAQKREFMFIQKMTRHLMDYFRFLLYGQSGSLKIRDEASHIEHYMEIQTMRFAGHLTYRIDIDPTTTEIEIMPMIIQPFVENTIIHGLTMDHNAVEIHIAIRLVPISGREWLEIVIEDNGQGFSSQVLEHLQASGEIPSKSNSIGIQNVKDRLKLHYGPDAKLEFANVDPHGARVTVLFPLEKYT